MPSSSQRSSNGKALRRRRCGGIGSSCWLFTAIAIIATIWNNSLVYGAPAKLDPIAVALPNDTPGSSSTVPGSFASVSDASTSVDVENVQLIEVETDATAPFKGLPDYIVQLNDPDIGGPVEYMPSFDNKGLSVLAWDLLPPVETDPTTSSDPDNREVQVSLATSQSSIHSISNAPNADSSSSSEEQQHHLKPSHATQAPFAFNTESTTKISSRTQTHHRGSVYYSSTTPRMTTTRRPTTTTTPRTTTTTTRRTTTTPRTTMATTTTTTTTTKAPITTTTPEPDSSEFFRLEAGDSYTLPPWLADIDDPDLDVAVTYIVPEDINQYNHTISKDILPPLEPYADLNSLHVTAPTYATTTTKPTTTRKTTRATTTTTPKPKTSTTTSTTTRRPTVSSAQPHWVRAKVTSSSVNARPSSSSFSNQITSSSQTFTTSPTFTTSTGNSNLAQRTTTTSTTTTTTVTPKTTINSFNRPLSNTDKIDSSGESNSSGGINPQNPFLNGSYKPQPFAKATTTTTRKPTTTSTTTTTTTVAPKVDPNPFEPTIPPWLKDFDYPDVGPGVPFVYDPNDDEESVDMDILPPSNENAVDTTKTTFVNSQTTATSFLNSQNSQNILNKFSSTPTSLTASSSIPSKVTLPLPSIEIKQDEDNTLTQPPVVFVVPTTTETEDNSTSKKTSSNSNTNFAARLEPTSSTTTSNNSPTKVPLAADRESFPPFNIQRGAETDSSSSTIVAKKTFSKSEDGKVITNNIFLNGAGTQSQTSTKPFVATTSSSTAQQKDSFGFSASGFTKSPTTGATFNQFTTSAGASGFVTSSSATSSTSAGASDFQYTGRFGGPPGLLAPNSQPSGFSTAASTTVTQTFSQPPVAVTATNNQHKFTGSFGGPPGVLTPYDNVKSG